MPAPSTTDTELPRLVGYVLQHLAWALYTAAGGMLVTMGLVWMVTQDFPGRWLVAVVGCVSAGLIFSYGARDVPGLD
ncbi:MAG: hypothetical protein ACOYX5_12295 [Actinomycetota bacterium]